MSQYQQQPYYQPQQQQPQPKKRSTRKFAAIGCGSLLALAIIIGIAVAAASSGSGSPQAASTADTATAQPTQAATQAPTIAGKWTTVQTFSGSGIKKTSSFTVPDHWRLLWSCDPASFGGTQYNLIVDVYNTADTSLPQDSAVNVLCGSGATHDSTELYHGGTVYLDINSEAAWTLTVQELK